jgi:hypothetical protein
VEVTLPQILPSSFLFEKCNKLSFNLNKIEHSFSFYSVFLVTSYRVIIERIFSEKTILLHDRDKMRSLEGH